MDEKEDGEEEAGSEEDREDTRSKVLFTGVALNRLASRIENANGDAPNLAAKTVIRPMAVRMLLTSIRG